MFTIYCHSPGGDAGAALSDTAFCTTYIQSPGVDNATALAEFALSKCSCYYADASRSDKINH